MLRIYKLVIVIVSILFFFTTFIISMTFNFKYFYNNWKDDRIQAIEAVIKNPKLFKIPESVDKSIRELYSTYLKINKDNISEYAKLGSSVDIAKNACLTQALSLIGNSLTQDYRAYKLFSIGGLSHGLLGYAVDMESYSKEEVNTYMNNLTKLTEAIPRNLPDKDILTTRPIHSITYYADYARIVYDIDKQIDRIDHDEDSPLNYGKHFADKIKGGKKK